MTTTRSMLPVLFVLLAACGDEAAPRALRAERVAARAEDATSTNAPASNASADAGSTRSVATSTAEPPARPARDPDALGIVTATFTHAVDARRPVDEARSFAVGEKATVHLVVKNLGAPREVTVEWLRGQSVLGRTTLQIGTSPAWRTWAFRRVGLGDVDGGVQVRVVDADGNALYSGQVPVTRSTPPSV